MGLNGPSEIVTGPLLENSLDENGMMNREPNPNRQENSSMPYSIQIHVRAQMQSFLVSFFLGWVMLICVAKINDSPRILLLFPSLFYGLCWTIISPAFRTISRWQAVTIGCAMPFLCCIVSIIYVVLAIFLLNFWYIICFGGMLNGLLVWNLWRYPDSGQ